MAENNFPQMMKTFVIIILFMFLLIFFITQFAQQNGKDTTDFTEKIGAGSVQKFANDLNATATNWKNVFFEQSIFDPLTVAGIVLTGMFSLTKTMFNIILTPFGILQSVAVNILGVPVVVVNIAFAVIVLAMIFSIWRLLKTGW
jgi:hypothetical protein